MRQTALWIQTGSAPGLGGAEIREFQTPAHVPLTRTCPQGKVWKAGKGQQEGWGLCWEQRTAPGHRGIAWREGQGKEELIKSALIQKHASKYWIKCKDTQSGRERPLPNKKQSPVLHVNTFLQDSQRQLVQVKNNKDWQVVQSSPPLTVRVSQN